MFACDVLYCLTSIWWYSVCLFGRYLTVTRATLVNSVFKFKQQTLKYISRNEQKTGLTLYETVRHLQQFLIYTCFTFYILQLYKPLREDTFLPIFCNTNKCSLGCLAKKTPTTCLCSFLTTVYMLKASSLGGARIIVLFTRSTMPLQTLYPEIRGEMLHNWHTIFEMKPFNYRL